MTRGYVAGLVFAVVITALTFVIVGWSAISFLAKRETISTPGIGVAFVPLTLLLLLLVLAWSLWVQSLVLLRGKRGPAWDHILLISVGAYLLWCLIGLLAGLSIDDTWVSPYAVAISLIWALSSVICWALLARRVYTDRPTPQWPWEHKGDLGPDWANTDENPWEGPNGDDPRGRDGGDR